MKKKLLAMCLVLALALSMMVPVFAATGDPASPNACSHSWMLLDRVITGYRMINGSKHEVSYTQDRFCTRCLTREANYLTGTFYEGHTPPCYKCHCGVE